MLAKEKPHIAKRALGDGKEDVNEAVEDEAKRKKRVRLLSPTPVAKPDSNKLILMVIQRTLRRCDKDLVSLSKMAEAYSMSIAKEQEVKEESDAPKEAVSTIKAEPHSLQVIKPIIEQRLHFWADLMANWPKALAVSEEVEEEEKEEKDRLAEEAEAMIAQWMCEGMTRIDVTLAWLTSIYNDKTYLTSQRYSDLVVQFLDGLRAANGRDQLIATILHRLPLVDEKAIAHILHDWCARKEHFHIGLSAILTLFQMQTTRAAKLPFLESILSFTISPSPSIYALEQQTAEFRTHACGLLLQGATEEEAGQSIMKTFAKEISAFAQAQWHHFHRHGPKQEEEKKEEASQDAMQEGEEKTTEEWTEPTFRPFFDLSLHLIDYDVTTFAPLVQAYPQWSASAQQCVRQSITGVLQKLPLVDTKPDALPTEVSNEASHALRQLTNILADAPEAADTLTLKIVQQLASDRNGVPPLILQTAKLLYKKREDDARFLVPVMPALSTHEIKDAVPPVFRMLNQTEVQRNLVRKLVKKMLEARPALEGVASQSSVALSPIEFWTEIMQLEKSIGLRKALEALQLCMTIPQLFKQEIMAVILQQLMDADLLPTLYMRLMIESVQRFPPLAGFINTLLSKMIGKKVWQNEGLWEGWCRCVKMIQPISFPTLLSLPQKPMWNCLERIPSLNQPLITYIEGQLPHTHSAAQQARLHDLLPRLDKRLQ